MYRSTDRRRRQKAQRPPTFRVENEHSQDAVPQYFQISINVLEARKLAWSNPHSANSYVVVVLGKKKYRSSIRRNTDEPYYKECFMYEMYASIQELQRTSLWLAVMEPRCCAPSRLVGEANIDLGAIWAQPHHQVFHKWAQLTLPRDPTAGPVGFLKVDVSIIFRGEAQAMPSLVKQPTVVENMLLPTGSEQQRANYLITVYAAFGLPSGSNSHGDKRYGKLPSTFVRVSFCGLVAKTAIQHRTSHPSYCEQISIVEMFPNLCQLVRLEVCSADGCFNRVLASTHLKVGLISHDGENGFLPTFGPSLLHMYGTSCVGAMGVTGEDGPFHRGALLVALKTIVPYYQGVQGARTTSVEPVTPIKPDQLWVMEDFVVFCPIFEVSMLDRRVSGKYCGVALTISDMNHDNGGDDDFCTMQAEIRRRKLHYTGSMDVFKSKPAYGFLEFSSGFPVLQLATRLPDFRFRMYRNNMVYGIVADLELSTSDVDRRLKNFEYSTPNDLMDELNKALDDAAANIIKFLDIVQYAGPNASSTDNVMRQYSTELDQKQLALQKEEMEKAYQEITKRFKGGSTLNLIRTVQKQMAYTGSETRKSVKLLLAEVKALTQNLKNLIFKVSEGWPDIIVWLLNGGSRVAYAKIPTAEIIHSIIPEQSGRNCGRIQTVYLKPVKCPKHVNTLATGCYCVAGKVELLLWMSLHRQCSAFEACLPPGMKLRLREYDMVVRGTVSMLECRVFIYKAKINNINDTSNQSFIFIRANAINSVQETKVRPLSSAPVWNQVLRLQKMVFTTAERLICSPPVVMIEVYESDLTTKNDLIGRFQLLPVVDDRQTLEHAPKLQWYEIYKGAELTGQVLMSVQILQVPEKLMKTTVYSPVEETVYTSEVKDVNWNGDEVEPLPYNLIPESTTYKVDIYWWGLRDVNITRKPCAVLQIDELVIKSDIICDKKNSSNFPNGRTSQTFEGPLNGAYRSNLCVKLYDSGTFGRTLFLGANVVKNPNKFVINWLAKHEREASLKAASITSPDYLRVNHMTYIKKSSSTLDEGDDYSSNVSTKTSKALCTIKRSTWSKIFCRSPSEEAYVLLPMFAKEKVKAVKKTLKQPEQKDWWLKYFCSQKAELENQPEFSKFKDWCYALKFYNGTKTGIPEKDEQLYCGFLKVGIAMYKWPPPKNTVAVSPNGVELDNGYFDDLPDNDPAQFQVRVYLVRGIDLKKKDFTGQSDPYIVLTCGKKSLGSREHFVKNTLNPIFGRMYEFRCNLPEDYLLTISLYDYEAIQPDELIGSTTIDLEDRIYSKHRARIGLAPEYNLTGPYKWRDCMKPSEILAELCDKNRLPPPRFPDQATVVVNGVEYRDNDKEKAYFSTSERKENICLNILHKWHTLPLCGHHLVPEHVETRTLYSPEKPGLEQGKIQIWVDMFPLDTGGYIPPPVDIAPRNLEDYELRLIVWDAQELKLDDGATASKRAPDIYVRAWIGSTSQAQDTDIHYRCSNAEGHFNWRMIFNFQYQHVERKIVVKEKGPFTEYEERLPPILIVQVMDTDAVLSNDFIGTLALDLGAMPKGEKSAVQCTLEAMEKAKRLNLFAVRSVRAWWPLWTIDMDTEKKVTAGVIDLEITLLPKEKAVLMPVGLGRSSPHPLPEPYRDTLNIFAEDSCKRTLVRGVVVLTLITLMCCVAMIFDLIPEFDVSSWYTPEKRFKRNYGTNVIKTFPDD